MTRAEIEKMLGAHEDVSIRAMLQQMLAALPPDDIPEPLEVDPQFALVPLVARVEDAQ